MNAKQMHGNERRFPVKRYVAWTVVTGATVASLFLLRSCNKPVPETIIVDPAVKTACGCFGADTTAPDSNHVRHVFVVPKQGCDSSAPNFDTACGCAEKKVPVKKARAKKKAVAPVTTTGPCDGSFSNGAQATGVKRTISDALDAKAGELRNALVGGEQRKILVATQLAISPDGTISAQSFTPQCENGCTAINTSIQDMAGIHVAGRQVEAVGGNGCTWSFTLPVK